MPPVNLDVSSGGRRYGRFAPALPLPESMMLPQRSLSFAPVVDLRPWCGPIKDQGAEGSCTGHAFSSAREWIARKYHGQMPVLSPQFAYVEALLKQGSFPEDAGSDGETLCNVLVEFGCCEAELWPYVAGQLVEPTAEQLTNARQYKLGAYHGLRGWRTAWSVIADPVPWPIPVGFDVYESFESKETAATGVYRPGPGEAVLGGHEVLVVGCDLGPQPTLRPAGSPPAFLIQNSWGEGWGWQRGYFWMPAEVLDAPTTDLKIIHSGGPWK